MWIVMIKYKCWTQGRTTSRYDFAQILGSMTPSERDSGFRIVQPWRVLMLIGGRGRQECLPPPIGTIELGGDGEGGSAWE
jgi:hypothetical protein